MEIKFRTLRADEIEVRPQVVKDGKGTLLLYIDSRAVVELLNETVGASNWTMDFKEVAGQTVGMLGIWDEEKGQFVYKSDTGSESNVEAQKGLFSDCYKRCLSRWGVDELYSAPKIQVPDDGYKCTGYKVSEIRYDGKRKINHLVIVNRFGKEVFRWEEEEKEKKEEKEDSLSTKYYLYDKDEKKKTNREIFREYCTFLKNEGKDLEELKKFYKWYAEDYNENKGGILVDVWKGMMNPSILWDSWMKPKRYK